MSYQYQNTPQVQIVVPTVDISGRIVYQPGPWGTQYPARGISLSIVLTDTAGSRSIVGSGLVNENGEFKIASTAVTVAFSQITLEIQEDFTGENLSFPLYPGTIGPNGGPQKLGNIVFPFKPEHPELAWINSAAFTDTKAFAKKLADILRSPSLPLSIDLFSEWRTTAPSIPIDDPARDDVTARVVAANGQKFKRPLPLRTPADVAAANRENARILRASAKRFEKPVPVLTPGQKLIRILSWSDLAAGLDERIVKEVSTHGITKGKANTTADAVADILERLSQATMQELEAGSFLRSLHVSLQRAAKTPFHFETVAEEAAADTAAASLLIFLAGITGQNKLKVKTTFNYWHHFGRPQGVTENRNYVKISVNISK
ncbi:MAG: hypothetical protein ABI878_12345 [Acidobacteriota bacterium]